MGRGIKSDSYIVSLEIFGKCILKVIPMCYVNF